METTIITWNATNFITVVLMVLVGFAAIGAVTQGVKRVVAARAAA